MAAILYPPFNAPVLIASPTGPRFSPEWVQFFARLAQTVAPSGSGPAPDNAQYLVGAADATLTAERVVTDTATVTWDLATAGQAKANVPNAGITYAKIQNESASTLLGRGSAAGAGAPQEIALGTGLTMSGTTLDAAVMSSRQLWDYKAKTTATSGYPGDGFLLWNNATQTSATSLLFSHLTTDNLDIDLVLSFLASGNVIILQDADASANFQKWTVSGAPTNTNPGTATSYWTAPVTLVSSGGTGTTGFSNNHQLIALVFASGGGTGTVTTTGSPASGNLAKFSGATSITNGDLSGDVTTSGTLAATLAASGVTAATYGSTTQTPQITVDAKGRITAASNVSIAPAGVGSVQAVAKPNDTTRSNTTTPTSDPDLTLGVVANAMYLIQIYVVITSANNVMDFKCQWSVPAGATLYWAPETAGGSLAGNWNPVGTAGSPVMLTAASTGSCGSAGGTTWGLHLAGVLLIAGTAGSVAFQWAQNTLDAGNLVLNKGSAMTLTRTA